MFDILSLAFFKPIVLWSTFVGLGYFVSWSVIPFVLLANKPPVSTLNWIWVLLLFPWFGPLAYFLIGSDKLARRHLAKRKEIAASPLARKRIEGHESAVEQLKQGLEPGEGRSVDLLACINEGPVSAAGEVKLLIDAQTFYPALHEAIRAAKHHIHIEFFIFRSDRYGTEFRDALAEAAKRGVEVRLLCDRMGSLGTREKIFPAIGRSWRTFRVVPHGQADAKSVGVQLEKSPQNPDHRWRNGVYRRDEHWERIHG